MFDKGLNTPLGWPLFIESLGHISKQNVIYIFFVKNSTNIFTFMIIVFEQSVKALKESSSQAAFTCSKLTVETVKQVVKYVQS